MNTLKFIVLFIFFISISCKEKKTKITVLKNSEKVVHYICANKCENSGSDIAGNCPTCNTPYTHNAAFHKNDLLKSGPLKIKSNATQPTKTTGNSAQQPLPAQNSKGVYHYTCKNGCVGGAGAATKCNSCGEILVHNKAYH